MSVYYIDASVLLENNQWYIFHILTSEDDAIYRFLHWIELLIGNRPLVAKGIKIQIKTIAEN